MGNITVGNPLLTSATGLLLFGNAVTGYFGRTDISTGDFDTDVGFPAWRARMKNTFMTSDPFAEFVTQFPGEVLCSRCHRCAGADRRRGQGQRCRSGQPIAASDRRRQLAPVGSGRRADQIKRIADSKALQETLAVQGWAVGQIPQETGLPDHGVLFALSGLSG